MVEMTKPRVRICNGEPVSAQLYSLPVADLSPLVVSQFVRQRAHELTKLACVGLTEDGQLCVWGSGDFADASWLFARGGIWLVNQVDK